MSRDFRSTGKLIADLFEKGHILGDIERLLNCRNEGILHPTEQTDDSIRITIQHLRPDTIDPLPEPEKPERLMDRITGYQKEALLSEIG